MWQAHKLFSEHENCGRRKEMPLDSLLAVCNNMPQVPWAYRGEICFCSHWLLVHKASHEVVSKLTTNNVDEKVLSAHIQACLPS
jgi:hypothetical protein